MHIVYNCFGFEGKKHHYNKTRPEIIKNKQGKKTASTIAYLENQHIRHPIQQVIFKSSMRNEGF